MLFLRNLLFVKIDIQGESNIKIFRSSSLGINYPNNLNNLYNLNNLNNLSIFLNFVVQQPTVLIANNVCFKLTCSVFSLTT